MGEHQNVREGLPDALPVPLVGFLGHGLLHAPDCSFYAPYFPLWKRVFVPSVFIQRRFGLYRPPVVGHSWASCLNHATLVTWIRYPPLKTRCVFRCFRSFARCFVQLPATIKWQVAGDKREKKTRKCHSHNFSQIRSILQQFIKCTKKVAC